MTTLISAKGLTVGYGQVPVAREIDLSVNAGEVVGLFGHNGAGKTTTLLTLSGVLTPISGEVSLLGNPCHAPLHRRARLGLNLVTEERCVFMQLSTKENLRVARADLGRALEFFPELGERMDVKAGALSGGEQQMLALARVLGRMGKVEPKVLLVDELSFGLAPLIVERLFQAIRAASLERGLGVLLVEQHVKKALRYCDRAYLLGRGAIQFSGSAADASGAMALMEESYLGGAAG
jgi:ABC-type branched-subunit amino acid transport system ATPase component